MNLQNWKLAAAATTALLVAGSVFGQAGVNTISAKPGALNYIEGTVSVNDQPLDSKDLKSVMLAANDRLRTENGKAEILLTPGVFVRVGENSGVRMVSPSLTDTQIDLTEGEMMLEASGLLKDNNLIVLDHGSATHIEKNGLYRFTAGDPPLAAVIDGKAEVTLNGSKLVLKKGHETVLADDSLRAQKFDKNTKDDLYAWSDVRSQYDAAASYRVSQHISTYGYGAYGAGFGPGGFGPAGFGSGWLWDNGFNSYAWLPYNGAFVSPFGYGFYSPGLVGYAPVIVAPGRGYGYSNGYWHNHPHPGGPGRPVAPVAGTGMRVPVAPNSGFRNGGITSGGMHSGPITAGAVRSSAFSATPHATYGGGGGAHPSFSSPAAHASMGGGGHAGGGAHR